VFRDLRNFCGSKESPGGGRRVGASGDLYAASAGRAGERWGVIRGGQEDGFGDPRGRHLGAKRLAATAAWAYGEATGVRTEVLLHQQLTKRGGRRKQPLPRARQIGGLEMGSSRSGGLWHGWLAPFSIRRPRPCRSRFARGRGCWGRARSAKKPRRGNTSCRRARGPQMCELAGSAVKPA